MVVFGAGEAVVGPEQEAGGQAAGEGCEEIPVVRADFGAVAGGEVGSKRGEGGEQGGIVDLVIGFPKRNSPSGSVVTRHSRQPSGVTLDEVEWQRVEQFVSEGDAGQRVGEKFVERR